MYYCTVAAIEQYILLSLFVPLLALACLRKIKAAAELRGMLSDPLERQEGSKGRSGRRADEGLGSESLHNLEQSILT